MASFSLLGIFRTGLSEGGSTTPAKKGCDSKSSTVGRPPLQASGDKMDSRTDLISGGEEGGRESQVGAKSCLPKATSYNS